MKPLSFSTKRSGIEVVIDDEKYALIEASGQTGVDYQNASLAAFTYGESGKAKSINGLASLQILLVGSCLYKINPDTGLTVKNPVGEKFAKEELPARVLKQLFEKAKEISHLDEEDTVESLQKQIDKLQERIDAKTKEADLGELPNDSEDGSE